jgi:prepilin-type N-terminal cleavage/methylation domain-containing protein
MTRALHADSSGFTLVEVLVALTILTVGLVAIAGMFPTGYKQVVDAGRMTLVVTAARQILEDVRTVPFASLTNLNGFDSTNLATVPAADPEMEIARRWRYSLAGAGDGFTFTSAETTRWGPRAPFGGNATVQVASPGANLRQITVTVSLATLPQTVTLSTVIASMQ